MVEQQDTESKQYFLSKIDRLTLDVNKSYQKEDYISRILTLAFDVLSDEQLRKFASLIFVGERTLSSFTVSDDVNIEYHEGKIMHISLSELLPEYKDTGVIGQIKQSLAIFPETQLSRLLVISPMSTGDIANKINNTNGYTPLSYLFAIYRARKVYNHYNGYVPSIDLTTVQESWIHKLLDILYSQKSSCITILSAIVYPRISLLISIVSMYFLKSKFYHLLKAGQSMMISVLILLALV